MLTLGFLPGPRRAAPLVTETPSLLLVGLCGAFPAHILLSSTEVGGKRTGTRCLPSTGLCAATVADGASQSSLFL